MLKPGDIVYRRTDTSVFTQSPFVRTPGMVISIVEGKVYVEWWTPDTHKTIDVHIEDELETS